MAGVKQPEHFSVEVRRNGEQLVTIQTNCLSGKPEFTEAEIEVIREAARHLLAFIGAPLGTQGVEDEPVRI